MSASPGQLMKDLAPQAVHRSDLVLLKVAHRWKRVRNLVGTDLPPGAPPHHRSRSHQQSPCSDGHLCSAASPHRQQLPGRHHSQLDPGSVTTFLLCSAVSLPVFLLGQCHLQQVSSSSDWQLAPVRQPFSLLGLPLSISKNPCC